MDDIDDEAAIAYTKRTCQTLSKAPGIIGKIIYVTFHSIPAIRHHHCLAHCAIPETI